MQARMRIQSEITSELMTAPRLALKTDEQLAELTQFYDTIAESFLIFDPLDRPILSEEEIDQATKHSEVMTIIEQMPYMRGQDLSVPLSNAMYVKLEKMITVEQVKCINRVDELIKQAKLQGSEFRELI